ECEPHVGKLAELGQQRRELVRGHVPQSLERGGAVDDPKGAIERGDAIATVPRERLGELEPLQDSESRAGVLGSKQPARHLGCRRWLDTLSRIGARSASVGHCASSAGPAIPATRCSCMAAMSATAVWSSAKAGATARIAAAPWSRQHSIQRWIAT